MNQHLGGAHYFLTGLRLLNQRGLRRYVIIPLIINIVLFAVMLYLGIHYFSHLTTWLETLLPSWLHWLNSVLWVLFIISSLIVITYTFTILANLVSAPFNGFLSETVEKTLTGAKEITEGGWAIIYKDIPRSIKRQLQFIIYYIPRAILALVLFFIPGVQVAAGPLWFLFNGWMMTVQYMDYPMDNHRISFKNMRNLLSQKRIVNLSFGNIVMFATMIPVVNFVVMPAAVIGATLLFVDEYKAFSSANEL